MDRHSIFIQGQPILSSYASSSIGLLIISCWLTISIWNLESLNEKYLLFTQLESKLLFSLVSGFHIFNSFNVNFTIFILPINTK